MSADLASIAFSGSLTDPEDISWHFSLGGTALDTVENGEYAGMPVVEACLRFLCALHAQGSSGQPNPEEERSLRMLVEDALGSSNFQNQLLPSLVRIAIEADNAFIVNLLIGYAEDQKKVLALANAKQES